MKNQQPYTIKSNLKYLLSFLWRKDRAFFFWGGLRGVTFVLIPLLGILLQRSTLDGIVEKWEFRHYLSVILILTAATMLVTVLNHCGTVGMSHYQGLNRMRFLTKMEEVFLRCPYQIAEKQQTQVELDKVSDLLGTSAERTGVSGMHNGAYEVFVSVLGLLVFGSMVGTLNIFLLVLVAAVSVGIALTEKWADRREFRLRMQQAPLQKKQDYFQNRLNRSQAGKEIRMYGCRQWLIDKLTAVIRAKEKLQKKQVKTVFQKDMALVAIEVLQNGAAVCWIVISCLDGRINIADFFVYLTAVLQLSEYVGKLIKAIDLVRYANLDVIQIRSFLDMEQEEIYKFSAKAPLVQDAFEIRLEHVYFQYPGSSSWLFEDLNLTIHKGEKLALVGNNGAGKTTIVKLLCGFYPATRGRILFDGQDIAKMDKCTLYRKISAVFQDIMILPFSVGQNVAVCEEEEVDQGRARKCLVKAGISEKLPDLYAKMDRRVYESGIELSGGEKQKLVFARALYKEAGFLILDEPTAALDPLAENRLYQQYLEISENKTTLFISHRLASTSFCDRIILLEQGKILEDGTHKKLLEQGGRYAEMFRLQSQYYQKEEAAANA